MIYRCFKRYRGISLNGMKVNIPYGSYMEPNQDGILCYKDTNGYTSGVMLRYSENAYTYFLPDCPALGNWENRVKLYVAIKDMTSGASSKDPSKYMTAKDKAYEIIWNDSIACKYRKAGDPGEWAWDRKVLHLATEEDLAHIWNLIKDCKDDPIKVPTVDEVLHNNPVENIKL